MDSLRKFPSWKINSVLPINIDEFGAISKFKEWLSSNQCECEVSLQLLDAYFFTTKEERSKLRGPIGWIGPADPSSCDPGTRPTFGDDHIKVSVSFLVPEQAVDHFPIHLFKKTTNAAGEYINLFTSSPILHHIPCTYGIYKKPGFDKAFEGMKCLKPDLTEINFYNPNLSDGCDPDLDSCLDPDLVTIEPFIGEEECLEIFGTIISSKTGKHTITLTFWGIDIADNLELLKLFLFPLCKLRDKELFERHSIRHICVKKIH